MKTKLFPLLLSLVLSIAASLDALSQCLINPLTAIGCWKGEGDPNDLTGLYPGTWTGNPAYAAAKVGSGFRLDGTNHLRVNDANALSPGAAGGSFTVEAWVNPAVWSGTVMAKGSGTGLEYSLSLNHTNGNVAFSMALTDPTMQPPPPPQTFTVSGGVGTSNQWHHVAGVFQPGNIAVFLDGVRVGTLAVDPALLAQNTTAQLFLGRAGTTGQNIAGQLDEVCLFPFALGDQTIQGLYAAGSLGKCQPTNCVTAPTNLVAWWPAEGNAADVIGNRSGLADNGVAYAPGRVGQAFHFDGVNDYVDCPNTVGNLGQFTFEFWVRINSFTDPFYMPLFGQTPASYPLPEPEFNFTAGNGAGSFGFSGQWRDNTQFDLRTTIPFGTNVWKHITVTYDGSTLAQFVDGQLLNQGTFAGKALGNSQHLFLGRGYTYPGFLLDKYLDGFLDEFAVYQRALNPAEIQMLYAAGAYGKCNPVSADSDGDGLSDAYEIANGSNPYDPPPTGLDNDADGLSNEDELNIHHTNPNLADTDGDGETDGMEVQMGTDPRDPNSVLHLLPPVPLPGGARRICWTSQTGRTYELQCADLRTNAPGGGLIWVTRTNVTAISTVTCVDDRLGSFCAYRVHLVPGGGTDTNAPIVSVLQLLSYVPGAATAALNVIARDIVGVTGVDLLDGNTVLGSATRLSGDTWRFSWNLNVTLNGRHYLRARARDAAGNYGYSPTLAFDVGLAGGSCLDIGPVRICADSATFNAGVYSFSGNIRINGIRLNAGATVTANGSTISGAGGVNVPGVGTVFSGTFDVNASTGWLTVRPSPVATYNIVALNSRISLTPRFAAVNVFSGAIQGAGAATVQVPGHAYGNAAFDGSFNFDPGAAKLTVTGTFAMGSALSGSGTAMLNLADSTFMLSGNARFVSSNGDAYTVSNGVATLYYAATVPYIAVSGQLGFGDNIRVDAQGTIAANGSMSLIGTNGVGTVDGFQFIQASGTLTRPAGASAILTLQFDARLIHPSLSNYSVTGSVRSTCDIDIRGTGQAIFRTNILDTNIVLVLNPFNIHLRGNYCAHTVSNEISGTLVTPNYLKPVNFIGIMRADGSVDIDGNIVPLTAASFSGGVPAIDAANLTLEDRMFVGCYQLSGRNSSTALNGNYHFTRTSDAAGGVSTLTATATSTTPGFPTLTLTGTAYSTGAASLTGSIVGQTTVWGYQVNNLSCTASRSISGVFTFSITGGTLGYLGFVGVAAQTTGSISSDSSGHIDFTYSSCTLNGYTLQNITLRLAYAASPSNARTLTVLGTGQLSIPGFPSVTAQVSGSMTNDGTFLLTGSTFSQLNFTGQAVASMANFSTVSLYRSNLEFGLRITGAVSGGLLSGTVAAFGTATANADITSAGALTLSGCITVEPLMFDQFRLESTQAGGRFSACLGPAGLTFPTSACLFYRGAKLTTPSLPSFTISTSGSFSNTVTVGMTAGATMNGFSLPSLSFVLARSGGVTVAQGVFATVSVPARNPGFSATTTFFVSGTLNMNGTFNLSGTGGSSLTFSGLPVIGSVNASAAGSVNFRDTGLTVSGSCSDGVLANVPSFFTATASLTISSNGIITLSGSVSLPGLSQSSFIYLEPIGGGNFLARLDNSGLIFSNAQVRVSGVFDATVTMPNFGFTMQANGSLDFTYFVTQPGFGIKGYGLANARFTFSRAGGILSISSIRGNLGLLGFTQLLQGNIDAPNSWGLGSTETLMLGGLSAASADRYLYLGSGGLTAEGTLTLTAGGAPLGSVYVSGSVSNNGTYSLVGSTTLFIGTFSATFDAVVNSSGVSGSAVLNYGGKLVTIPLTITPAAVTGSGAVEANSGWTNPLPGLWGKAKTTLTLTVSGSGTVTSSLAPTLYWWAGGSPPANDNQAQTAGVTANVSSNGEIAFTQTVTGPFGTYSAWSFDLW